VGGKKDVPKNACYVGRYRDSYVWVGPDGLEELSRFTITVMKFATLVKDEGVLTVPIHAREQLPHTVSLVAGSLPVLRCPTDVRIAFPGDIKPES
jgi:hypothetical protein